MRTVPINSGKPWTPGELSELKALLRQNTPTRVLGLRLRRTASAIQAKANDLGLSTRPLTRRAQGSSR